jgi:hypothetical protein
MTPYLSESMRGRYNLGSIVAKFTAVSKALAHDNIDDFARHVDGFDYFVTF